MTTSERKLRVFLCHASQDKPVVRELYRRLLTEGWIDPWLDEEKLLPGQDWDIEIEKAVELTDAVIVCLSKSSVTKDGYIQKEIRKVLDVSERKPQESIFVIPLKLEECEVPRRLQKWHWGNYFPRQAKAKAFELLLSSLKQQAGYLHKNYSFVESTEIDQKLKSYLSLRLVSKKEISRIGNLRIVETTYAIEHDKFLDEKFVKSLILKGENSDLEFLSNLPSNQEHKRQLAKTIGGLMNDNGGIILMGIAEYGEVIGIGEGIDEQKLYKELRFAMTQYLDSEATTNTHIDFIKYQGKTVCGIKVDKSEKPVFVNVGKSFEFFVRFGNSTVLLNVKDAALYVHKHWIS